jgi:hypothetical protein
VSVSPLDLQQTCSIAPFANADRYSGEVHGAPVVVRCRAESSQTRILTPEGALTEEVTKVYLPAGTAAVIGDLVTLPGGDVRAVAHVSRPPDHRGQDAYVEVTCI